MDIVTKPNKILAKKLNTVKKLPEDIVSIVSDMKEAMYLNNGVGLAANQVGIDMQLFVIDEKLAEEHGVPSAYINPEITAFSPQIQEMEEGCLSIPKYYVSVKRSKKIMIKTLNEKGEKVKFKARGFLARVLQHEYDHLNGKLIEDRAKEQNK